MQRHRSGTIMDIYEVELCRRGRWEQQDARFVAAVNADEAAYKVTGEHLQSEGERRKVRLRVRRLGNGRNLLMITKGTASAYVQLPSSGRIRLATFGPGTTFGELALLDERPRSAT